MKMLECKGCYKLSVLYRGICHACSKTGKFGWDRGGNYEN